MLTKEPLLNETFCLLSAPRPTTHTPRGEHVETCGAEGERGSLTQGSRERESEWGQLRCALRLIDIDQFALRDLRTSAGIRWLVPAAAARRSQGDGTHVSSPGASRSLAEKETRKRTASCATPKLTVANWWLTFILMSDQRLCDLKARGEATATRPLSGLFSPADRA